MASHIPVVAADARSVRPQMLACLRPKEELRMVAPASSQKPITPYQRALSVALCAWGIYNVLQLLARIAVTHPTGFLLLYYAVLIVVCGSLGVIGVGVAKGRRSAILAG